MKKLLSLFTLSLLIGLGAAQAQTDKVVVLECFTSTTCGPCASTNPALDQLINNNANQLIAVKYHVNWPAAGDPMNLANPSDVSSKVSYYGINSVPYSAGNGTWIGHSGYVTQNMINQWVAEQSPVEMQITHYFNDTQDTMFVVVMGRAVADVGSNNLKLNVAIIEKTMEYTTAPGSNGERIFHNVMKKMLPRPSGESIPALTTGDYFAFKYSWALNYVFDINELTAVAWLQDGTAKTMYQGCMETESFQPYYAKQAKIWTAEHMKERVCSGSITPYIIVDNFGSETINTLKINVYNNEELLKTIDWTGNIPTTESAKINIGELTFDVEEASNVTFEIELINGAADDYATATYTCEVEEADLIVNKDFKLYIRPGDTPGLNTWEVVNTSTGEVVVSGGPYENAGTLYTENFSLDHDGCYMLTVYDGGNTGNTSFSLKGGNKTLFTVNKFTDLKQNEFSFEKNDEVAENSDLDINIYPNPSNGLITIEAEGENTVSVYSITGQAVKSMTINGKTTIDLSDLNKGVYMMVMTGLNGESLKQMIVLE